MKNIQNEDFGLDIFEKSQILWPFSGLAPSNCFFSKKVSMKVNVHIEYSYISYFIHRVFIYFKRIEGGGVESIPPLKIYLRSRYRAPDPVLAKNRIRNLGSNVPTECEEVLEEAEERLDS